jgi:hypothetical protein
VEAKATDLIGRVHRLDSSAHIVERTLDDHDFR